ncbi:fimbrial protein [Phytobacter sp. AG2a]
MRYFLLIIMWVMFVKPVYATAWGTDCNYTTKIVNVQIPSGKKITIDPNAPVGTVFFEHYVPAYSVSFQCSTSASHSFTRQRGIIYAAGGQAVSISGGGLYSQNGANYSVYKTNVPGIGLVARVGAWAWPYWWNSSDYTGVWGYSESSISNFDIDIVKYGDIPAGARTVEIDPSVISGFDQVMRYSNSADTTGFPNGDVILARFVLSPATFDIVTGTCDTPDFTVDLGKRRKGDTSNREGGKFATPWTDASIRLTNCPVFYGTGERGSNKDTVRDNVMTVTLTPGNATTSNQGIMPVDNVSQAATGVGIQLAYGTAASPQLVSFSGGKAEQKFTMSSSQGQNYTIPLVARYIQTAGSINDIMPGKANGKITYLINYY